MTDNGQLQQDKRRALELVNQNRLTEARQLYRQITRRAPADATVWFMLGTVEGRMGNLPAAEQAMCAALQADSNLAEAWLGLGQTLELQGREEDACNTYLKALSHKPQLAEAHAALGRIYNARGWFGRALGHLSEAVGLGLERPRVLFDLGDALRGSGQPRQALELYCKLQPQFPGDTDLLARIAAMHYGLNEIDQAERCFEQVLQLKPDHSGARLGLINIWYLRKQHDRALTAIRSLFEQQPHDYGVAMLYAQLCHLDGSCRRVIEREEALLAHPGLTDKPEALLCFDLGRLYDAVGEYDRAFGYLRRANALKKGQYDRDDADRSITAIMAGYTPEVMARTATLQRERHQPLFIVGMPRSGTSLVEQILASHPQVYGAGELTELIGILRHFRGSIRATEDVRHEAELMSVADLNAMAGRYLERLDAIATGNERYISDKMPSNFFRLGLVYKLFPYARIIHVRRNPIDTCLSCYFQDFTGYHTYCYDLDDLVHYYKNYRRLMAYWRAQLPCPMLEVDYEQLVAQPEQQVRRMLDFLALDWDDRCMQFHTSKRAVITASHAQVQNPIHDQSVSRWRNYARHIGPLIKGFADETGT